MKVHLAVMFDNPGEEDIDELREAALELTNDRQSVRVFPKPGAPRWLIAEFTMPAQPQYAAVAAIDRCGAFRNLNRIDSAIGFPKGASPPRKRRRRNRKDETT